MANGRSPNPLNITQDDVEFLRSLLADWLLVMLKADGTVKSTGLQVFNAGLLGITARVDVLSGTAVDPAHAPTVAVGAGAGTGATATLVAGALDNGWNASSNLTGTLQVTTGTSPTANATLATVTVGPSFAGNAMGFANDARVILFPADKVTRQAAGPMQHPIVSPNDSQDGWIVTSNDTPLAASTTYSWTYLVTA